MASDRELLDRAVQALYDSNAAMLNMLRKEPSEGHRQRVTEQRNINGELAGEIDRHLHSAK